MTIRARLIVSTFLLQVISMALLGWGVLAVRRQYQDRDLRKSAALIEMAVERAASDSLIQKDDVALLSYMKFLQLQYPAIAQARIDWKNKGRDRAATVGAVPFGADTRMSRFTNCENTRFTAQRANVPSAMISFARFFGPAASAVPIVGWAASAYW